MTQNEPSAEQLAEDVQKFIESIEQLGLDAVQEWIALGVDNTGRRLSVVERGAAMQAALWYEARNVPIAQRTGFVHRAQCASQHNAQHRAED